MRLYVAASASNYALAEDLARDIRCWGHEVTSEWHQQEVPPTYENQEMRGNEVISNMAKAACMDETHVRIADAIVIITGDTATRGGRHSECGIAIALGKRVYLLGPREQVFHWHPLCCPCNDKNALRVALDMAPPFFSAPEHS